MRPCETHQGEADHHRRDGRDRDRKWNKQETSVKNYKVKQEVPKLPKDPMKHKHRAPKNRKDPSISSPSLPPCVLYVVMGDKKNAPPPPPLWSYQDFSWYCPILFRPFQKMCTDRRLVWLSNIERKWSWQDVWFHSIVNYIMQKHWIQSISRRQTCH